MSTLHERVDALAEQAEKAASEASRASHNAMEKVAAVAHERRDEAAPAVDRMRRSLAQASDRTVGYVRDEPVRTVLMAAAAGAVLYAMVRLFNGRHHR
jgi:ElaB/YqjD/DUF883 family membrane-anchored ribosome-binding protein